MGVDKMSRIQVAFEKKRRTKMYERTIPDEGMLKVPQGQGRDYQ
jgi:hypothetical protein